MRGDYTGLRGFLAGAFYYAGGASQGARAPIGFSVDPNGNPVTPPTAAFDATVRLFDIHAEYRSRGWEMRGLYAAGSLDDAKQVNDANGLDGDDAVGERFKGWYLQAGWDALSLRKGSRQSLIPFVRYESFNTQERVPGEIGRAHV